MTISKILFPTDFSACADNAFIYALKMAMLENAEIIALHIESPLTMKLPDTDEQTGLVTVKSASSVLDAYAKTTTKPWASTDSRVHPLFGLMEEIADIGVEIKHQTEVGTDTPDLIAKVAEQEDVDLIVMGTHGLNRFKNRIFGSTAAKVLDLAPMPVLLIPEYARYKEPNHLVFAVDFDKALENSVPIYRSLGLADKLDAHLSCVHLDESHTDHYEASKEKLEDRFSETPNLSFEVRDAIHAEDQLKAYLSLTHASMLIMDHRRPKDWWDRFMNRSFTQDMSYEVTIPLLSL